MEDKNKFGTDNDARRREKNLDNLLSSFSVPAGKGKDSAWKDVLLTIDERGKQKNRRVPHLPGSRVISARVYFRYVAIAASIIVGALLAVTIVRFTGEKIYQTDRGEILTISLPDQTEVTLNSDSRISYTRRGWKNNRQVSLSGGRPVSPPASSRM